MTTDTNPKPGTRKVTIGALSGAVVTIIAYALTKNDVELPQEIFAAASTVVTALLVYLTKETYG